MGVESTNFKYIEPIKKIVEIVLHKKEQEEDTAAEERQIDLLVYKLYGLSYDEVRVVDPQPPFSREEYEGEGI